MEKLKIGDTVNWNGSWGSEPTKQAKVVGINKARYFGDKEGKPVNNVDWSKMKNRDYTVSLDNNHWAYAFQISPL